MKTKRISIVVFCLSLVLLPLWLSMVIVNVVEAKPPITLKGRVEALEREVIQLKLATERNQRRYEELLANCCDY